MYWNSKLIILGDSKLEQSDLFLSSASVSTSCFPYSSYLTQLWWWGDWFESLCCRPSSDAEVASCQSFESEKVDFHQLSLPSWNGLRSLLFILTPSSSTARTAWLHPCSCCCSGHWYNIIAAARLSWSSALKSVFAMSCPLFSALQSLERLLRCLARTGALLREVVPSCWLKGWPASSPEQAHSGLSQLASATSSVAVHSYL